jgi:hypothetical protein
MSFRKMLKNKKNFKIKGSNMIKWSKICIMIPKLMAYLPHHLLLQAQGLVECLLLLHHLALELEVYHLHHLHLQEYKVLQVLLICSLLPLLGPQE